MIVYGDYTNATEPGVIQFENANEGRSYPFADNIALKASTGVILPENIITDMRLVIPKGSDAFLSSVYISPNMVSICIKITNPMLNAVAALSCTVKSDILEPYIPYRMEKLTGSEDVGGIVTFGTIDFIASQGTYRFEDNYINIAENAISRYTPARLRKFIDPRTGESLSGDVKLEFSTGVTVTKENDGVRLSLSNEAKNFLMPDCDKNNDTTCGATPVESINGIKSDDKKRIVLWFH